MKPKAVKALALISGGLDSALAIRLMQEQGVEVVAVNLVSPFGHRREGLEDTPAKKVASSLGVHLVTIPCGQEYLNLVSNPQHGYGSNMNPCIDCRIYMLSKAREVMPELGASFVVTGEVVGQRPMSQKINIMRHIEKASGLEGYLLRPLSALLLVPTIPESKGWVRREQLLAISGRSRKQLLQLAEDKGVTVFSSPGGGCLLTDPEFARRIKDLLRHGSLSFDDIGLLKVGRHFRLPLGSKLVIGRNQQDNAKISGTARPGDIILATPDVPGPIGILMGERGREEESLAAGMVARYSDGRAYPKVKVSISTAGETRCVEVRPLEPCRVADLMV
jgi:tRNA-specific 2-thiouridylase